MYKVIVKINIGNDKMSNIHTAWKDTYKECIDYADGVVVNYMKRLSERNLTVNIDFTYPDNVSLCSYCGLPLDYCQFNCLKQ
jgi:NAD-dependent dihydropyrimidine dehydrogenase PreA subunit